MIPSMQHLRPKINVTSPFVTRESSQGLNLRTLEDVELPSGQAYLDDRQASRNYYLAEYPAQSSTRGASGEYARQNDSVQLFNALHSQERKPFPNNYELYLRNFGVDAVLPDDNAIAAPIMNAVAKVAEQHDLQGLKVICSDEGDNLLSMFLPDAEGFAPSKDCILIRKNKPSCADQKEALSREYLSYKMHSVRARHSSDRKEFESKAESIRKEIKLMGSDAHMYYKNTLHELGHVLHERYSPDKYAYLRYNKVTKSLLRSLHQQIKETSPKDKAHLTHLRRKEARTKNELFEKELQYFGQEVFVKAEAQGKKISREAATDPLEFVAVLFANHMTGDVVPTESQAILSTVLGLPL